MKKKFIYILVGMVCFLSFNNGVRADYKRVCEYSTYITKNNVKIEHNIEIYYDAANEKEAFKLKHMVSQESDKDNAKKTPYEVTYGKNYKMNNRFSIINGTGSTELTKEQLKKIEKGQCPATNVAIDSSSDGMDKHSCFYDSGIACKAQIAARRGIDVKNVYLITATGERSENKNYNIKDDDKCRINLDLKGNKCAQDKDCNISLNLKFNYNKEANSLDISYNTEMGLYGEFKPINGDPFKFKTGAKSSSNNNSQVVNYYLRFDYSFLDLPDDIEIDSRAAFDEKFLKLWEKEGKCPAPSLSVGRTGKFNSAANNDDFFIYFPDAVKYFEENGSDIIDTDDIEKVNDWNVIWPEWPDLLDTYENCEALLGPRLIEKINDILNIVRIAVPIFLVALGIMDFAKAVFSTTEDAMKKAQIKFIKRLIMGIVVFLVPTFVNLIFNTVNGVWAHINNGACNIWG